MDRRRLLAISAILAAALALAPLARAQDPVKPETSKVRLAVGGKSALYYLPLTVTERLGFFKDARLQVEITDLQGGSQALHALVGRFADVGAALFPHTTLIHAQKHPLPSPML